MKNLLVLIVTICSLAFITSCGGSDDPGADLLADAPSGEIVALELRDEVLTGVSPAGRGEQELKWWRQDVSVFKFTPQCDEEDEELRIGSYSAFDPSGEYRGSATGTGTGQVFGSWSWASPAKDAITLTKDGTTGTFTIRGLNESEVIYASYQVVGGGCAVATWEQFSR